MKATSITMACLVSLGGCTAVQVESPRILTQPYVISVSMCQPVTLNVDATGTPPLVYSWSKDGVPLTAGVGASVSIQQAKPTDAGTYSVVVTNSAGRATSDVGTVAVGGAAPPIYGPAVVAKEAGNSVVRVGDELVWTFSGYVHATSALCPGAIERIIDDPGVLPFNPLASGNKVIWADGKPGGGGIYEVSVASGGAVNGPLLLARNAFQVGGLAIGGNAAIWTDMSNGDIQSTPLDPGGTVTTYPVTFPTGMSGPEAVASDGQYIVWSDWNGPSWQAVQTNMIRVRSSSGDVGTLANDQGLVSGIATDGAFVYWVATTGTSPDVTSVLRRVAISGGQVLELASRASSWSAAVFLDSGYVYWTSTAVPTATGTVGSGAISKTMWDGSGVTTTLVDGLAYPGGVYVDQQYVYWAEYSLGSNGASRVMRAPK